MTLLILPLAALALSMIGPLLTTDVAVLVHLSEPEAAVLSTNFEDILREQPPLTLAAIGMVIERFTDTDIADGLRLTQEAVRMRKSRFRKALYDAARKRRIRIPEQLHTKAGARRRAQRGAA
ncbi:hypothetical protein [Streptomyces leeuwenhoekii]|uniref:RNA polymerase sigma factor 70 region 4 type 2 domain-containing protein n=1 Tax=Streptomyces leeuwenhoekii TaxID=1437453 RepID=A0A0F7VKP8_STRLW|nr:hypothetical protein [Streptomyces leeuwenhoekii]CQR59479.1 Hypothetical Protein sle_00170 [Streptomyces leeuwenhoekii]